MKINILSLLILITTNFKLRAQNWNLVNSNTTLDIVDMYFYDDSSGFFLTRSSEIFYTQDLGENWNFVHRDTSVAFNEVIAFNDSVFVFGLDINGTPIKSKSSLNIFSFTKDTLELSPVKPIFWKNELWDVARINQLLGLSLGEYSIEDFSVSTDYIWASNDEYVFTSNDFGQNWQIHQFAKNSLSSGPYLSYYNGTPKIAAITQYPTIIHSTTNAITWTSNAVNPEGVFLYFVDESRLLAYSLYGTNPNIYMSSDGGQNFTSESLIDIPSGIYAKDHHHDLIFIYGKNGMLYKSTTAGGLIQKRTIEIKIYPNPTSQVIYLKNPNNLKIDRIKLVDVQGNMIKDYENQLDILTFPELPGGTYMLIIEANGTKLVEKFIIQ
ncbi:MAG: T9SS type A sorting domain-containing protein [Crocinitomix sp.]|nr:T9SS type A sorting domain-containing protein [Crocinitomix sp.]